MYTLSEFKAKVNEIVAGRTDSNSFDPTDENTKIYAQGLVTKITESAKCETVGLFGFTTDQIMDPLATNKFNELVVEGKEVPEVAVMEAAATAVAEDTLALVGMFKDFSDKQEDLLKLLVPVVESTPGDVVPVKMEEIVEGTPAAGTDTTGAAAGTTEDAAAADTAVTESGTITIVPATERTDNTPWGSVDKAAIKERLRVVKEAGGEGIDAAIAEVYAVVGSVDDPASWKYPHHIIEESGAIVLSITGLAAASNYLQSGRFTGPEDQKQSAAGHLQGHYDSIQEAAAAPAEGGEKVTEAAGYPCGLSVLAGKTPGLRMVSVDLIKEETIIPFEEAALTTEGKNIAVVEACANLLHGAGFLSKITESTILTISPDQFSAVNDGLIMISNALMGNLPQGNSLIIEADQTLVTESAAQVERLTAELNAAMAMNSQLTRDVELRDSKIEALSTLSEGSALEGIAESVVSSQTLEQVRAFKAVTDNPGLKRLITAAGNSSSQTATNTNQEIVTESSPGTKGLENLDTIFDEEKDKGSSKTNKRGNFAALYV